VVHLHGQGGPFVAKGLGCRVAESSFCTTTNGPTLSTGLLSGYAVMAGRLYTTLYMALILDPVISLNNKLVQSELGPKQ